jgi:nucleoside-diphosphate-sugar epimerase
LKKVSKKKIAITGGGGLLGSYFYKKYKKKYNILRCPHRIENFKKINNWIKNKSFENFIHFAAITRKANKKNCKSLDLINVKSSINILNSLKIKKTFKYFLFISSSHVYGFSKIKIKENKKRIPHNAYGLSKKKIEDFIINNRKKFNFKIGIARIFNFTGKNQKKGFFVPDMIAQMKKQKKIFFINQSRDFVHIDDISKSIEILMTKKIDKPTNICSGKKINLIKICKILNKKFVNKKTIFDREKGNDIFGDNSLLKSLGIKKFKNIDSILSSYKK